MWDPTFSNRDPTGDAGLHGLGAGLGDAADMSLQITQQEGGTRIEVGEDGGPYLGSSITRHNLFYKSFGQPLPHVMVLSHVGRCWAL